ncbi:RidA family protein [Georgenia sp. SYP-B2076]|uniref:RidA family protein n=1 Tax=Georgenia sp. SYP-B2076 TaxID=2495881 RepID=UPI000F8E174F|nr:Rid family hydrolase [Georgenia sp. SYP-B2076]
MTISEQEAGRRKLDVVHHEGYDSTIFSPYVPAIRIAAGVPVFISGVTAAPPYHDHPHKPETFDSIALDMESQVELLFEHLDQALRASGCGREHVVSLSRFFTNVREDQDIVNRYQGQWFGGHVPTSTSVEVVSLATDPRLRLEIAAVAVAPS